MEVYTRSCATQRGNVGPGDSKETGTEIDNIKTDRNQKNGKERDTHKNMNVTMNHEKR
jgi:hypothetical protein